MAFRWDEFAHESLSSDFNWAGLAAPSFDAPTFRQVAGAKQRKLDRYDEIGSGDFSFAPSAVRSATPTASLLRNPDTEPTSPPVSSPVADVVRKWNFDNIGRDDLVFRASSLRDIIVLATNGTRYTLSAPTDHRLLGIADFTGDGIADLLFGSVVGSSPQFLVKVVTNTAGVPTISGTGDFAFTSNNPTFYGRVVIGIGDLDGNGRADFLRRDVYDGTGDVLVNFSTGTSFSGASVILSPLSLSWSLAGIGDINGDGRDDLVWRNLDNTVSTWLMGSNGIAFTSVGLASVGHEWKLEAVTRLDSNDQLNDLVWRNVVSGRTIGWIMNAVAGISSVIELGTFSFDLEYVGSSYEASASGNGGTSPRLIWRRVDGTTIGSILNVPGRVSRDELLVNPITTETHFRTKMHEAFDFGARSIWGVSDVLEPMRTRSFGGMGVSGGNTGRIPLVQAEGGVTVLFSSGGALAQFTPQAAGGGNFTLARNLVLVGMGDFNSDGVGIDLFYRDSLFPNGAFISRWNTVTNTYEAGVATGFSFGGIALFNDSRILGFGQLDTANSGDDVVWQNRDGLVYVGRLFNSGASIVGSITTATRIQSREWVGQGVTDLNGDGRGDIVWRNAKTGSISYWSLNATELGNVTEVFINTTPVTLEWDLVGMGDLDGDGDGDLIWRRNTDGFLATWLFQGGELSSVAGINARGWDWRFEGTSDVNGDGKTDLVWRNASGQYAADLMNGSVVTSTIQSGSILFDRATMGWNQAFMRSL